MVNDSFVDNNKCDGIDRRITSLTIYFPFLFFFALNTLFSSNLHIKDIPINLKELFYYMLKRLILNYSEAIIF